MDKLASFTTEELQRDLRTARIDLCYCHAARKLGTENPARIARRERANQAIIDLIEGELRRRESALVVA